MLRAGITRVEELPATAADDLFYCLLAEDTREARDHREKLDALLDSQTGDGKPDRATWGKLPHQQRRMRAAEAAAGG